MQNQAMLLVSDMGLEIPVPEVEWQLPEIRVPVSRGIAEVSIQGGIPKVENFQQFEITRLGNGNYELNNPEFLRDALEFMYKTKKPARAPLISRMIDTSGMDISNARIKSCTVTQSYRNEARTIELELYI